MKVLRPVVMLGDMIGVVACSDDALHNEAAFETCLAGAFWIVAALEFSSLPGQERPTREVVLSFADEIDRYAQDLAAISGESGAALREQGRAWFEELMGVRDDPLQAAYHSLHAAAYLGLAGEMNTARVLCGVGWALRVLAEREGRLTN